jgi:hypothetical protein
MGVPFLESIVVIIAGYIIRRKVAETPVFAEDGEDGTIPSTPILKAFRYHCLTCSESNAWR